jgi:hypothetical protein
MSAEPSCTSAPRWVRNGPMKPTATRGAPVWQKRMVGRLLVPFLLMAGSCTSDGDTRVVDFSQTIEVARPSEPSPQRNVLRVAVGAMVSPKETFAYYRELLEYLGAKIGKEVALVQRRTYGEINDLLGTGKIDLAFVCSGPYALEKERHNFELLATPEVNRNPRSTFAVSPCGLEGPNFLGLQGACGSQNRLPCHALSIRMCRPPIRPCF